MLSNALCKHEAIKLIQCGCTVNSDEPIWPKLGWLIAPTWVCMW